MATPSQGGGGKQFALAPPIGGKPMAMLHAATRNRLLDDMDMDDEDHHNNNNDEEEDQEQQQQQQRKDSPSSSSSDELPPPGQKQQPLPVVASSAAAAAAAAAGIEAPPTTLALATTTTTNTTTTGQQMIITADWNMRDAAIRQIKQRSGGGGEKCPSRHRWQQRRMMVLHHHEFDVESSLNRLCRDKIFTVRQAFYGGATAVLQALQSDDMQNKKNSDDNNAENWKNDLPTSLSVMDELEKLRNFSFERSYENKEYTKRKGGKTDPNYTPPVPRQQHNTAASSSSKKSSSTAAASTKKKIKKETTTPIEIAPKPKTTSSSAAASSTTTAPTTATATTSEPKFTRNTPASSAAALDSRSNSSRAILCSAGSLVFAKLTPDNDNTSHSQQEGMMIELLDPLDVPQKTKEVNMGAVSIEAKKLANRTVSVVENAMRRSDLRYKYRLDCAEPPKMEHPFSFARQTAQWVSDDDENEEKDVDPNDDSHGQYLDGWNTKDIAYSPSGDAMTDSWQNVCLPRFLKVLQTGAGHAIFHDLQWSSRHGRIADLLRQIERPLGPHLIVTTKADLKHFAQEFEGIQGVLGTQKRGDQDKGSHTLHALVYKGQRKLRKKYFSQASGLPEAPFHVLVTTYCTFLKDYLHFCQIPFDCVVMDDGAAWMASSKDHLNSPLGNIWESAIFSSNDHHVGLAGTTSSGEEWDFGLDDEFPEAVLKEAWIGLTARHRILTASWFALKQRQTTELMPVSALIDFVVPHFSTVVKEEWDRSRIAYDSDSMQHFRKLVARSVIVHCPPEMAQSAPQSLSILALQALTGKLPSPDRSGDPPVPNIYSDEQFVSSGLVPFTKRATLLWFGHPPTSWLRYEIGLTNFFPILNAMKVSNHYGHFCEEIATASSFTSSGATGQVAGTMAYRLAVRCGRHFGSEQGVRQHYSAHHAPPGTWLCRTCSADCVTSQARTHHERSCGQLLSGAPGELGSGVGATPTVGQGGKKKSGVGKKKAGRPSAAQQSAAAGKGKDPDGSMMVPKYRGVWVNKAGKHFVKIDAERLIKDDGNEEVLLFDTADEAAKKHDEVFSSKKGKGDKIELNFKPDGTRILYEDIAPASTSGLAGSAADVVPALSVINIKDLPPDVKPLLRDPRQTSRTGGNSKRHIYAYRGVCRQARKGHDRWQSQISFMGVNHYLGTFDSEWDAAAIYAWAHLILYGEEATRQAQKEGEEAAAAYEQEKKDIAAGKIVEPAKPKKKKRAPAKKKQSDEKAPPKKRGTKTKAKEGSSEKKPRTTRTSTADKEATNRLLAKAISKVPILAPKDAYEAMDEEDLILDVARKVKNARDATYSGTGTEVAPSAAEPSMRPCVPRRVPSALGGALLAGLSPTMFDWDLQEFVESRRLDSDQDTMAALQWLAVEYDDDGINEKFGSLMQGTTCIIGSAGRTTEEMYNALGLGTVPMGGSVGSIDCHIGGVPGSCSERAACIQYIPSPTCDFRFTCLSKDDIVTLNGRRILPETGSFPLYHEDVCSVGARVFVFLLPGDR